MTQHVSSRVVLPFPSSPPTTLGDALITRDVGDRVPVRYKAYDVNGNLVDATVAFQVTSPTGGTSTPGVTHTSTGIYDSFVDLASVGRWSWQWTISGAVIDVAYGQVDAANPAPPKYVGLDEFKKVMKITNTDDDDDMISKLASAQERVEKDTGRRFWRDSVASTRVYTPRHLEMLRVDDIATDVGVIVEIGSGTSWSTLDPNSYEFQPDNAIAKGEAIEYIKRVSGYWNLGFRFLGVGRAQRVRVTAVWGWPAIPEGIKNATILQAARLLRRKDSPEGIKGFSDFGVVRVTRYDPDYDNLIGNFVRDEM